MKRTLTSVASLIVLSLSFAACSSSSGTPTPVGDGGPDDGGTGDGGACAQSSTGSLTVTITGLPSGVSAAVKVTGPSGDQTVSETTTISAAKSGDYTVVAPLVTTPDPIVRKVYKGTVSTATTQVCDGQSAAITVDYALIPTSNTLWWGNENQAAGTLGYHSAGLASTATASAAVAATTAGHLPGAFDRTGNLWVLDRTAGEVSLLRYAADSLGSSGAKTADVTVTSPAFEGGVPGPVSLAFDANGNAWVGIEFSGKVVMLSASSLAASGSATPAVELSNVDSPAALAFDASGNLFVGTSDRVVEYLSSRLAASSAAAPDLSIEAKSPSPVVATLTSALGLAFDSSKNLWVDYDGVIAKITAAERSATGTTSITPSVQIKTSVLSLPEGLAFDEGGGLWFAYAAGQFAKLGRGQLAASGTVTPDVVVTSDSVGSATSPAFYPAPAGLPLFSSIP